jgi:tRNA(Ile2) C34 agmatinyltransferase TiaS
MPVRRAPAGLSCAQMEFRVGDIVAKCPECGGTQFKVPPMEHSGPRMNYHCAKCGSASMYAELMGQIGREALKRKHARLSGDEKA